MKRYNKRNFTLIEIMFVVGILVILIGISWVAGNKILRKQAETQTKAELKLLHSAVTQYKTRWGSYPDGVDVPGVAMNFAEYLSKVSPTLPDASWDSDKPRPMYIDYSANNISVDYTNYAFTYAGGANTGIKVQDPYEQDYYYVVDADGKFYLYSVGLDATAGTADDIRSDQLNQ